MADLAKIAAKEQQKAIRLLSQIITELGIRRKEKVLKGIKDKQKENAGDYALLQQDILERPDHYHILYLEHGDKEALKALMEKHDIAYLEIEASVLEHNNGGFIISDIDYITLKNEEPDLIQWDHRYTEEQLKEYDLDENGQTEAEREEAAHDHNPDNEHKTTNDGHRQPEDDRDAPPDTPDEPDDHATPSDDHLISPDEPEDITPPNEPNAPSLDEPTSLDDFIDEQENTIKKEPSEPYNIDNDSPEAPGEDDNILEPNENIDNPDEVISPDEPDEITQRSESMPPETEEPVQDISSDLDTQISDNAREDISEQPSENIEPDIIDFEEIVGEPEPLPENSGLDKPNTQEAEQSDNNTEPDIEQSEPDEIAPKEIISDASSGDHIAQQDDAWIDDQQVLPEDVETANETEPETSQRSDHTAEEILAAEAAVAVSDIKLDDQDVLNTETETLSEQMAEATSENTIAFEEAQVHSDDTMPFNDNDVSDTAEDHISQADYSNQFDSAELTEPIVDVHSQDHLNPSDGKDGFGLKPDNTEYSGNIENFQIADDILLDGKNGRSVESLENALYDQSIGRGIDEAHGKGYEYAQNLIDTVAPGMGGMSGLIGMQQQLQTDFTAEELNTMSILMKEAGFQGLDFTSQDKMEQSFKDLNKFLDQNKLVEGHRVGNASGQFVVDNKAEFGRAKFGQESARHGLHGEYKHKQGEFKTNYKYASQNLKKLENKHNQGIKKDGINHLKPGSSEKLAAKMMENNGRRLQNFTDRFNSWQAGNKMHAGEGGVSHLSLNWKSNAFVEKATSENEAFQGLQKPKQIVSVSKQSAQSVLQIKKIMNEHQALNAAKKQTAYAKKIKELKAQGKLTSKDLFTYREKAKKFKIQNKIQSQKAKSAADKLDKLVNLKSNTTNKLKQSAARQLKATKAGKAILAKNAALQEVRRRIVLKFMNSALGKVAAGLSGLKAALVAKLMPLLTKFLGALFAAFMQLMQLLLRAMILGAILDLIAMFFIGNNKLEEDPRYGEIEKSTLGNVYNNLVLKEAGWARYLKFDLFTLNDPTWLSDISGMYTNFLPSGEVDWDHFHMTAEDYVTQILQTDYSEEGFFDKDQMLSWHSGESAIAAKGPEPFEGAPEEAYKWIRLLDGGVEVRFRGIGGGAGHTSNVKEIMAMTAVAQTESNTVVDDSPTGIEETEDESSAWDRFADGLKAVGNFFVNISNAITNGFTRLLKTIPAYYDWWVQQQSKRMTRMYMLYAEPLFEYSHTEEYSLQMAIHPTQKTIDTWNAEHPEELNDGEVDDGYGPGRLGNGWGYMCSSIEDQTYAKHMPNDGIDYSGEHGGYGCKSFDQFAYKYDSVEDMYYNDTLAPQVKAASQVDLETDICVAPGDDGERWLQVTDEYGHSDCWEYVGSSDAGWQRSGIEYSDVSFIDAKVGSNKGYCYIGSSDGGNTYTVGVAVDSESRGTGRFHTDEEGRSYEEKDTWYHIVEHSWKHNCKAVHTGYYCGGHLKVIVTGGIYHMSDPQKEYNEDMFEEKYADSDRLKELEMDDESYYNDKGLLMKTFHVLYDNDTGEPFLVPYVGKEELSPTRQAIDACRDLFDIDCSYTHKYGHVNIQSDDPYSNFMGWNYDFMNVAAGKLEDDWYDLYGILPPETTGGEEGGSANGLAADIEHARQDEIMAQLDELYGNDPSWPARRQAVETALTYVGHISYSQKHHGNSLSMGGMNDCSGYVSQCWKDVLQKTYTTASFYHNFPVKRMDGNIKPGDIILHYDGAIADSSGDHALMYIGKDETTGKTMSVDCTGSGTWYRSRGSTYYNQAYYIDMSAVLGY